MSWTNIVCSSITLMLVIASFVLALYNVDGWGWFLFVAFLIYIA